MKQISKEYILDQKHIIPVAPATNSPISPSNQAGHPKPEKQPLDSLTVTTVIVGIMSLLYLIIFVGFFLAIAGFTIGLINIKKTTNKTLNTLGIILNGLCLALGVAFIVFIMNVGNNSWQINTDLNSPIEPTDVQVQEL